MTLMIIVLSRLSGEDKPTGIAEWGKDHGEELVKLMQLNKTQMPSVNTHRRILAEVVCQEEVERMVGKYNQGGGHGEGNEYLLSPYDVKQGKVLAQVEAGRKEDEISKAPKALEYVEISQKVITGE